MIGHLVISLPPQPIVNILRRQGILEKMWLNLNAFPERRVTFHQPKFKNIFFDHLYQSLMYWSLPGLLHYEDRNSMAHSIEARVPFLDYRLAEFVFSLPMDQIIRNGTTKVILREVMEGILPERVRTRRDKMGFVTPEDIWIRTILKEPFSEIIASKSFKERGYFRVTQIQNYFNDHCQGKINISSTIWRWINLELWFRKFIDQESNCRL
jgi:asparagine synthase (glutamine-hydrolysing)